MSTYKTHRPADSEGPGTRVRVGTIFARAALMLAEISLRLLEPREGEAFDARRSLAIDLALDVVDR